VPYLDNYRSDSFGPKDDPSVFGVLQLLKYFANFPIFISHAISNFQKHRSLTMATLTMQQEATQWDHSGYNIHTYVYYIDMQGEGE
jgi:hypothetical protein